MEEAQTAPALTARAKKALGSTQAWARFTGFVLFCVVLLTLIRYGVNS